MTALELSVGLPPGPDFADLAVLAEQLGYDRVYIFDSAPLWEDPFAHLALAAVRTSRIGLSTAVLIPSQRSAITMASGIATIARLSNDRFRACFGTGFTARMSMGKKALSLDTLFTYVATVRTLLAGGTATIDGKATRMAHFDGMTAARPVNAPLWVSAFGPKGSAQVAEFADGTIGPPHPTLPAATMVSGTVLDPGEEVTSQRVLEAVGPWRVVGWHGAYAVGGAAVVDSMPGGAEWRAALEALAPEGERHTITFEGHVTHLPERDRPLVAQSAAARPGRGELTGDPTTVRAGLERIAQTGFAEVIYTPSGPDVAREITAFAAAHFGR